jgi:hypothetical protein
MLVLKLKIVDFRSQLRSYRIIKTPKSFDWLPTPMPKTEEKETNVDEKQEFFQKAQDGFHFFSNSLQLLQNSEMNHKPKKNTKKQLNLF